MDSMRIGARSIVLIAVLTGALAQGAVVSGQEAPAQTSTGTTKPAPPPAPDFVHQEELTGDWRGARTKWKAKGVALASSLTQFYQGVSSGGTGTSSEYNGTAQAKLDFDF